METFEALEVKLGFQGSDSLKEYLDLQAKIVLAIKDLRQQNTLLNRELKKVNNDASLSLEERRKRREEISKTIAKNTNSLKQLSREQREVTNEIKAINPALGAYDRLNAELNTLFTKIKNIRAAGGVVPEADLNRLQELDAQLKEIDRSLGRNQRNVGNYEEAIKNAIGTQEEFTKAIIEGLTNSGGALGTLSGKVVDVGNSFKALSVNPIVGTISLLVAGITALFSAFTKTERGADLLARGSAVLQGILSEIVGIADSAATAIVNFAENPLQGVKDLGDAILENISNRVIGALNAVTLFGEGIASLVRGDFENLKSVAGEAATALTQVVTGLNSQQQKDFANSVAETTTEISKNIDAWAQLGQSRRAILKQNIELSKQLESLITTEESLNKTADDATKSFAVREQAAEQARQALEARATRELQISQNNLSLINQEIALRRANGEAIDNLLQNQLSAFQEVAAAERGLTLAIQENEQQRAQLRQDRLERDLDILIDGFYNQKTINERVIADDRKTVEERQALLDETTRLANESFDEQIKTIQSFTGVAVDANELISESDAVRLNEQIRSLGLSEIIEGRLLEIIRDRRTAIADLGEAQSDLNQASEEANVKGIEAARDKQIQALILAGQVAEEVANERVNIELEAERKILQARLNSNESFGVGEREALELELAENQIAINKAVEDQKLQTSLDAIELRKNAELQALLTIEDAEKVTSEQINQIKLRATIASIQERLRLEALSDQERAELETELAQLQIDSSNNTNAVIQQNNNQLLENLQTGLDAASNFVSIVSQLSEARLQREQNEINERYDAELEAAEGNAEEITRINEERDAALEEIEREAFERQKRLQIAQALISGAQAVVSTLAAVPGPLDLASLGVARALQIAFAVATTAAQVAAISSQTFGQGGLIEDGKPHSQGGNWGVVQGASRSNNLINFEKGEAFINKRSIADKKRYRVEGTPKQIASAINSINGNGKKFAQGASIERVKSHTSYSVIDKFNAEKINTEQSNSKGNNSKETRNNTIERVSNNEHISTSALTELSATVERLKENNSFEKFDKVESTNNEAVIFQTQNSILERVNNNEYRLTGTLSEMSTIVERLKENNSFQSFQRVENFKAITPSFIEVPEYPRFVRKNGIIMDVSENLNQKEKNISKDDIQDAFVTALADPKFKQNLSDAFKDGAEKVAPPEISITKVDKELKNFNKLKQKKYSR